MKTALTMRTIQTIDGLHPTGMMMTIDRKVQHPVANRTDAAWVVLEVEDTAAEVLERAGAS